MEHDPQIYAARLIDRKQLYKSSSGGMFTAISDFFLDSGWAVVCSVYCFDTNTMEFSLCTSKKQRDNAIGSKYFQSNPGDIFNVSVKWLKANPKKKLCFFGVGCQTAAFKKFLEIKGLCERVFFVDIICHGVSSPLMWQNFVTYRFEDKILEKVTFKDKRRGWLNPTALVCFEGQEVEIPEYVRLYYNGCILRPSCAKCPYATMKRVSDITIGDFWNIEKTIPDFFDEVGTSLVLVQTEKGEHIFNEISAKLEYRRSNFRECCQPNLVSPTTFSTSRKTFWEEYLKHGFKFIYKKYAEDNLIARSKRVIKRIIK